MSNAASAAEAVRELMDFVTNADGRDPHIGDNKGEREHDAFGHLLELDVKAWKWCKAAGHDLQPPKSYVGSWIQHVGRSGVPCTQHSGGVHVHFDSGWKAHMEALAESMEPSQSVPPVHQINSGRWP